MELLDFFRECRVSAPFLFFNGNTFAEIARRIVDVLFEELPLSRRREVASLTAHFVAGTPPREMMISGIVSLVKSFDWKIDDRVQTLRGSLKGRVLEVLEDGRIKWQPDDGGMPLISLPETLKNDQE